MGKVNSIEKLLAILELLSENPYGITAEQIKEKMEDLGYEYTLRSAQKDISDFEYSRVLSDVFIVKREGKKKILKFKGDNIVVKAILDKLRYDFVKEQIINSIPQSKKILLEGLDSHEPLKLAGFNIDKGAPPISALGKLMYSIRNKRYISFTYERLNKKRKMEYLKPYKVVVDNDGWYLLGQFDNENFIRTFLIDFISNIKIYDTTYKYVGNEMEMIERDIDQAKSIWYLSSPKITVKALLSKEIGYKIKEMAKKGVSYFSEQEIIKENDDGSLIISFKVADDGLYQVDFKRQVYFWLPDIKILSPDMYKEFLRKDLKKITEE